MSQFPRLLLARWGRFLGFGEENPTVAQTRSCFAFACSNTAVCAALALRQAFASDYVLGVGVSLQQCIRDLHIDFWLLDQGAFTPAYLANNRLLRQLKVSIPSFDPGVPSAFLERPPPKCAVFADAHFVVVDARAVLALGPSPGRPDESR